MPHDENTFFCSFCNKSQYQVRKLIRAPGSAAICDECISMSVIILREEGIETPGELPNAHSPGDFGSILEAMRRHVSR